MLLSALFWFGIPALVFLLLMVAFPIKSGILQNAIETSGVVIGFEGESDEKVSVIRFTTHDGREITIHGSQSYTIGQIVTVRYLPDHPEKGQVKKEYMGNLIMRLVLLALPLVLFLPLIIVFMLLSR